MPTLIRPWSPSKSHQLPCADVVASLSVLAPLRIDQSFASGSGNNVLVGRLDFDNYTLNILSEIGDSKTISPEGVTVFDNYVAAANYDGGNVQIFSVNDEKACDLDVPYAHGIAYADGFLFATSLSERQVVKIDVEECEIVKRVGKKGWGRGNFLWPTSIGVGNGAIVIADAHTGMVTTLSTETMEVIDHWGGNGPGAFNMPYGVEVWGVRSGLRQHSTILYYGLTREELGRLGSTIAIEPAITQTRGK